MLLSTHVCSTPLVVIVTLADLYLPIGPNSGPELFGGAFIESYSANGCILWEVAAILE